MSVEINHATSLSLLWSGVLIERNVYIIVSTKNPFIPRQCIVTEIYTAFDLIDYLGKLSTVRFRTTTVLSTRSIVYLFTVVFLGFRERDMEAKLIIQMDGKKTRILNAKVRCHIVISCFHALERKLSRGHQSYCCVCLFLGTLCISRAE